MIYDHDLSHLSVRGVVNCCARCWIVPRSKISFRRDTVFFLPEMFGRLQLFSTGSPAANCLGKIKMVWHSAQNGLRCSPAALYPRTQ